VLRGVLRTRSVSQQQAMRARIVLRAVEGASNTQIAADVGVSLPTVGLWRRNFSERGLEGLATAPRSGRPREIDDAEVQRVLAMTLEAPPDGSTHWSARRLAAAAGSLLRRSIGSGVSTNSSRIGSARLSSPRTRSWSRR
jgi:transposase